VGVLVAMGILRAAQSVSPNLIIAANAMDQLPLSEGIERAIEGYIVGSVGQAGQNLRSRQRLLILGENTEDSQPHGGAPQARFAKGMIRLVQGLSHVPIIAGDWG
jgi:hypothetical protein